MWQPSWNLFDRALFGPHTLQQNPLARLLRFLRYPYAIIRDLIGGELTLRATGLVYTTLLALIPLIALSFAVLKAFGAHRDMAPFLLEFFRPVGEAGPQIVNRLMSLAENVSGGLVGVVGLTLLLWTLIGTVNKIEDSLNFVWRVQCARSIPRRVMEFAILVTIGPLVVATVIAFTKLAFDRVTSYNPENFTFGAQAIQLLIQLAPYAIVTGLFTALYLLMPNTRVRLVPALVGALVAGILWAATGKAFTAMVLYTSRLTLVYAGFAIVVAVFLWTYLGWLILLAGAQLAFYVQNPNYLRVGHAEFRLSSNEQERLALDIMARVAMAHRAGSEPWTLEKLARVLALPGIAIAGMSEHLEHVGLLAQLEDDKLFPGREISSITLAEIISAARTRRAGHDPHPRLSAPGVLELQADMERAWRNSCGERTLAELISKEPPAA
ncbi:MAG: YihY/virulence factor BrkB family protein [Steroidobacteraceae bacterium]